MNYLEALIFIHQELSPENYVEIGCRLGTSMGLSRCQSIGVDPDFEIRTELKAPARFFKMTSDDFFIQYDVKALLGNAIDLAFIDGMHKAEYVLRDFINIEKNSHPGGLVIIDDVLPEKIDWATRERSTKPWTGDVYKIITILRQYRPDLHVQVLDVEMKGMALITGLNPASTLLSENYSTIERAILSEEYKIDSAESLWNTIVPIPAGGIHNLLRQVKSERMSLLQSTPPENGVKGRAAKLLKFIQRIGPAYISARVTTGGFKNRFHKPGERSFMRDFKTPFNSDLLKTYQEGVLSYRYKDILCLKSPLDVAIYMRLLGSEKPKTIFEIGSKYGGSALLFSDVSKNMNLNSRIISIDLDPPPTLKIENVSFLQGDILKIEEVFEQNHLHDSPRPWAVIEDSAHTYSACLHAIQFFSTCLQKGEMMVVEDGILSEMGLEERYDGGPNRAIMEFFARNPDDFDIETTYCDMFGTNATYNPNGYLRKR